MWPGAGPCAIWHVRGTREARPGPPAPSHLVLEGRTGREGAEGGAGRRGGRRRGGGARVVEGGDPAGRPGWSRRSWDRSSSPTRIPLKSGYEAAGVRSASGTGGTPAVSQPTAGPTEASPLHDHLPCHEAGEYGKPESGGAREAVPSDEQARPCGDDPRGANGKPGHRLPAQDLRPCRGRRERPRLVARCLACPFGRAQSSLHDSYDNERDT